MIGGYGFALARARAALRPLLALAVVAAIAAAVVAAAETAVHAAETRELRGAVVSAPGDGGRLMIDVRGGITLDAAADEVAALVDAAVGDALEVSVDDGRIVVAADARGISSVDLPALVDLTGDIGPAIEEASGASVQVSGSLDRTLAAAAALIDVRRGPTVVAMGLLAVMVAVVVAAVAVEPVRTRRDDDHLLRARGARVRTLASGAAAESFVVALVGALAGCAATAGATALVGGDVLGVPILGGVAVTIAVIAAGVSAVATARGSARRTTRARAVADVGTVVVLGVVTVLAAWQFARTGTPVLRRGDGTTALDPLVAIAPALVLALATLVAVAAATPLARAVAAVAARGRRVAPVTPLRLMSRRPGRHALSIVVVAFAVGALGVAAAYQGSLVALGDDPEELRVGADLRVGTIPDDVDLEEIAALEPADAAMRAWQTTAQSADGRIPILAVQAPRLAAVMPDAGGSIDPVEAARLLSPTDTGSVLAGDTLTVEVSAPESAPVVLDGVELAPVRTAAYFRVTLVDAAGVVVERAFTNFDGEPGDAVVEPETAVELELPAPSEGAWSLAGLAAAVEPWNVEPEIVVTRASSGGEVVPLDSLRAASGTPGTVEQTADGIVVRPARDPSGGDPWTRIVADGVPSTLPAVVTGDVAAALALEVGDDLALEVSSPSFAVDVVVVDVVPVLPGSVTGSGLMLDLATLTLAAPVDVAPDQVWMSTADPDALASTVAETFPQTVTTVADPRTAQDAAATGAAFALAAGGAVLLALVALALRRSRERADARELALLAVMGLGRAGAARIRAGEDLFAVAMGVVGGSAAGVATAWLVVPPLVRAAYDGIPAAYPVALHAQPLVVSGSIAVATVLFCLVVTSVRAPVRLAPLLREDE